MHQNVIDALNRGLTLAGCPEEYLAQEMPAGKVRNANCCPVKKVIECLDPDALVLEDRIVIDRRVAAYLAAAWGTMIAPVDEEDIETCDFFSLDYTERCRVYLPVAISNFIEDFDAEEFPNLICPDPEDRFEFTSVSEDELRKMLTDEPIFVPTAWSEKELQPA